jgi:hypothetical protein
MTRVSKHFMQKTAKPRGKPWKKGQSGNPKGRPKGAKNKLSLAVLAAERTTGLDRNLPYNSWFDRFVQFGRQYHKQTLALLDPEAPSIPQLEMLDLKKPRQEMFWKGRDLLLQDGWPYCRRTLKIVKI